MSDKQSTIHIFWWYLLTYLWVRIGISYSISLASLVDLSIDVYVRESFPSGVCKIDSFIGLENLKSIIIFFLFSENHIWMLLGSFHFILCRITITDRGHNGAYKPSSWTGGSLWSLSIMVSFPVEKLDWAHPFKVTNGKLSRKSRWFLCRDSLQINIKKETEK